MYSVKNVKSFIGHEGYGFNASLYRDKKKVAFVMDDASGGPINYQWLDFREKRVECEVPRAYGNNHTLKCTPEEAEFNKFLLGLPKRKSSVDGKMLNQDADMFMCNLIDEYENNKRFKRLCKKNTIVHMKDNDEGEYTSFKVKFSPIVKKQLMDRYGDCIVEFVNERF